MREMSLSHKVRNFCLLAATFFMVVSMIGMANEWSFPVYGISALAAICLYVGAIATHLTAFWNAPENIIKGDDIVRLIKPRQWHMVGLLIFSGILAEIYAGHLETYPIAFFVCVLSVFFLWGMFMSAYLTVREFFAKRNMVKESTNPYEVKDHGVGLLFLIEIIFWIVVALITMAPSII